MHIPHERSKPRRVIHILQDKNSRSRNAQYMVQPIQAVVIALAFHGRIGRTHTHRRRVAHRGREIRKNAMKIGIGKTRYCANARRTSRSRWRCCKSPTAVISPAGWDSNRFAFIGSPEQKELFAQGLFTRRERHLSHAWTPAIRWKLRGLFSTRWRCGNSQGVPRA